LARAKKPEKSAFNILPQVHYNIPETTNARFMIRSRALLDLEGGNVSSPETLIADPTARSADGLIVH
jgi:hypothetical protein